MLMASFVDLLQRTIIALQREFAMKDLGHLHHFLGIAVECRLHVLKRTGMSDCKPFSTLVDSQAKISKDDGPPVINTTSYRCFLHVFDE